MILQTSLTMTISSNFYLINVTLLLSTSKWIWHELRNFSPSTNTLSHYGTYFLYIFYIYIWDTSKECHINNKEMNSLLKTLFLLDAFLCLEGYILNLLQTYSGKMWFVYTNIAVVSCCHRLAIVRFKLFSIVVKESNKTKVPGFASKYSKEKEAHR